LQPNLLTLPIISLREILEAYRTCDKLKHSKDEAVLSDNLMDLKIKELRMYHDNHEDKLDEYEKGLIFRGILAIYLLKNKKFDEARAKLNKIINEANSNRMKRGLPI